MKEANAIRSACNKGMEEREKEAQNKLNDARAQMESSIRFAVFDAVFSGYPSVPALLSLVPC